MRYLILHCLLASLFGTWLPFSIAGDNVVIVLDDSGSMNERMGGGVRRIDAAKNAIAIILKQFPADTKLGLLLLNGDRAKQHWAIPLDSLSVTQAARRVETVRADGGTPLGDRMREGADALLQLREKQIYGNYRLLVVTDGEANDAALLSQYLPDILCRGVIVDAIGVDMKKDHTLATRVHSYRRADDAQALSKAVQEVFAEKSDSSATHGEDDYALLNALEDETAKEALSALAKPNNASISGLSAPVFSSPASPYNNLTVSTSTGASLIGGLLALLMSCAIPLFVVLFIVFAVMSKSKGGNKSNGRRG